MKIQYKIIATSQRNNKPVQEEQEKVKPYTKEELGRWRDKVIKAPSLIKLLDAKRCNVQVYCQIASIALQKGIGINLTDFDPDGLGENYHAFAKGFVQRRPQLLSQVVASRAGAHYKGIVISAIEKGGNFDVDEQWAKKNPNHYTECAIVLVYRKPALITKVKKELCGNANFERVISTAEIKNPRIRNMIR